MGRLSSRDMTKPKRRSAITALSMLAALAAAQAIVPARAAQSVPRASPATWVMPAMRSWAARGGEWKLGAASRIVIPTNAPAALREVADALASDIATITGIKPAIATKAAGAGDIRLILARPRKAALSREAYDLDVANAVTIQAANADGLYYGTQSLLQLLTHNRESRALPRGSASDWPDYRVREMMIDVGRKYYAMESIEQQMRKMAWLKVNTLHLHFTDWPAFRLNSPRFPGLAPKESYSRADVERIEETARRYHIMVIPEIDLPAHASALITYRPSLAFNCEALRQSWWLSDSAGERAKDLAWLVDITRQENRDFIKQLLDEFIPWFKGPYFHIGGDEYNYDPDKVRCPELMAFTKAKGFKYPGDVFVDWINETDKIVRSHGKTTIIWNWWRFNKDETSIEPNKSVVIEVWNVPRFKDIVASGYKVIASPDTDLYVVPGLAGPGKTYGQIEAKAQYNDLELLTGPNVLGYSLALWADKAENFQDARMLSSAYGPLTVLAERIWAGRGSATIEDFKARVERVGAYPGAPAE